MARDKHPLSIDARPRGPHGLLAGEQILGRTVLAHHIDLARRLGEGPIPIHARFDEHGRFLAWLGDANPRDFRLLTGPPPEGSAVLRTDRIYDPYRLEKALRKGRDPESAVLWRLDRPAGLAGVEDELIRRRSYQPLGRFWALSPARWVANRLCPTRVTPNVLTLASAGLVLSAALLVAFGGPSLPSHIVAAFSLALGLILDTADGHLARLQGTVSEFGRWLDANLDELGDMALHAAVAWSACQSHGNQAWLGIGMFYGMGKYLFIFSNLNQYAPKVRESGGETPAPDDSALAQWVRIVGHADVRWHVWIVLAALGRLEVALIVYAAYYPTRALAAGLRKGVGRA